MNSVNIDIANLKEIETFSVYIAREAGHLLLDHFNKPLEISYKGEKNTDPVTIADRLSDEYLKQAIKEKFPAHNILSEEGDISSQSPSRFTWVLDPLDGTTNFMNGLPFFAVSVGVLWGNLPVAGSIYVPVSHKATEGVYHGSHGNGAFFNAEKISVAREPPKRSLSDMPPLFRGQFRLSGKSRKEPLETRNLGSIALELVLAASGIFQFAVFSKPKLWDVLAGVVLVKEAGGVVFTYGKKNKRWKSLDELESRDIETETQLGVFQSWSSPVIAGTPDTVYQIVKDLHVRHNLLGWINILRHGIYKPSRKSAEKRTVTRKS